MTKAVSARGAQVVAWSYATFSVAAFFVLLRLVVRWKVVRLVGKEDGCIIAALVAALLCCVFMSLQVIEGGLGQHWDTLSYTQITHFLKFGYFSILFYSISLCLTKFGLVLLCLRVFAPSKWRKACFVVLGILTVHTLWVVINSIVRCNPIRKNWDKKIDGWCFPKEILWFLNAGLNIFTDILIVSLPIPGILALKLPRKQKIGVSLVFALGFFVCIISIVRLHAVRIGTKTQDPTYDNYSIGIWSVIEVNAAIVGACLPTLKPLIVKVWPRLLSSETSHPTHATPAYFHGTHDTARQSRMQSLSPDTESVTEILGDGVGLAELESKGPALCTLQIEHDDDDAYALSCTDTPSAAERRNSTDNWKSTGRSPTERTFYNGGSDAEFDAGKAC